MSKHFTFTLAMAMIMAFSLFTNPAFSKNVYQMPASEAAETIGRAFDESVRLIEEIKKIFIEHPNITSWVCPIERHSSQVWHELEYRVKEEGNLSLDLEDGYIYVRRQNTLFRAK